MNPNDPNVQLVEGVVQHLGELKDEFVFVGGCATGLLVTDPGRPPVRATTDVDLLTSVATRRDYYQLAHQLRELGFTEDRDSDVLCRWRITDFRVDVMPVDQSILGFSNRWYGEAYETATICYLPSGETVKLISPILFLATKLEAFHERGNEDFGVSHDMEDVLTVVDGRPELMDELATVPDYVKEYLREEFDTLLSRQDFVSSITWHLAGDAANQARAGEIIRRLRAIAEL